MGAYALALGCGDEALVSDVLKKTKILDSPFRRLNVGRASGRLNRDLRTYVWNAIGEHLDDKGLLPGILPPLQADAVATEFLGQLQPKIHAHIKALTEADAKAFATDLVQCWPVKYRWTEHWRTKCSRQSSSTHRSMPFMRSLGTRRSGTSVPGHASIGGSQRGLVRHSRRLGSLAPRPRISGRAPWRRLIRIGRLGAGLWGPRGQLRKIDRPATMISALVALSPSDQLKPELLSEAASSSLRPGLQRTGSGSPSNSRMLPSAPAPGGGGDGVGGGGDSQRRF